MKKIREKKQHSLKSGKANKEQAPSRNRRDPSDRGDPRGTRSPQKDKKNAIGSLQEKGDKNRIKKK